MRAASTGGSAAGPDELYCFRAGKPRASAARRADYLPINGQFWQSAGYLFRMRHPHVSPGLASGSWRRRVGDLRVALPQAQQRIVEGAEPSVNCDLEREPDAQPGE